MHKSIFFMLNFTVNIVVGAKSAMKNLTTLQKKNI